MSPTGQAGDELFLVTQFTAPRPPAALVERDRLATLLRSGLSQPVTLVCAPAGAGKTTLMSTVLGSEAAWLSLEPGDDAPDRFWRAVLLALRNAGAELPALRDPSRRTADTFPPLLVNALAELPERVVLAIDDVQLIRSRSCLAQLAFLVLHAPPTLALVLGSRADPALPLHVLRVRGQLTEIRARELAFTAEEAAALLTAHELELPRDLIAALCARTEGWAAGLRLAALGLRASDDPERYVREFTGSDAVVGDYLVAEVLERLPARVRRFLLETSILERMTGELADAVTESDGGADTLDMLDRTNAFVVAVDQRRQWFRHHGLLAALLRARARRELGDALDERHRRAARWYAGCGMSVPALRHALEGGGPELGLEIVGASWFELLACGRSADILALIDRLPPERVQPGTAAIAACAAFDAGDGAAGTTWAEQAAAGAEQASGATREGTLDVLAVAEICAARGAADCDRASTAAQAIEPDARRQAFVHLCVGEAALWAHRLDIAADELVQAATLAREAGYDYLTVTALGHLAVCEALKGDSGGVLRHAREALAIADHGDAGEPAAAQLALGLTALAELRVREAHKRLGQARALPVPSRGFALMLAHAEAELHAVRGDPTDGLGVLDRFAVTAPVGTPAPYERAVLGTLRARLHAALGDLDAAERAFAAVADEAWLPVTVAGAQLKLAQGDPAGAVEVLEGGFERTVLERTRVERAVLLAVALEQSKDPAGAREAFEHALELAEPSGHRWAFLTFGRTIESLLRDRIRQGTQHRAFVGELLDALDEPERERTTIPALLEPLTDRERAILRFLPTRLSNNEMAAELFISCNTVKTHLRSIYRKLDVDRRNEAVRRARELKLLNTPRR